MSSAPGYGAYLHFESHQVAAARSVQMASYKSSSFACFIMAAAAVCVSKRDHFETRYILFTAMLALGRFPLSLNSFGLGIHLPEGYSVWMLTSFLFMKANYKQFSRGIQELEIDSFYAKVNMCELPKQI